MSLARYAARHVLLAVDRLYRRWHHLSMVGPLLHAGQVQYDGPPRHFADGTELRTGDLLGTLHFDNARIAGLEGNGPGATGLQFRRLLFASLRALAERARPGQLFHGVAVYRGIGWVRHGERIGFIHEPAPDGWRTRWATLHVRLLVWAFAAPGGTAGEARPELTITWLTRRTLVARFGKADCAS
jgi:hypothetical protein